MLQNYVKPQLKFVKTYKKVEEEPMGLRSRQTFLQGALILVISSIFVKIFGAVFKIPLVRLIEEDGIGFFNTAYTLYAFFVLAARGISVAVSKMVAESNTLGNARESNRILKISLVILGSIGVVGTGFLYFYAEGFAALLKNPNASASIKAIAPSVMFVALVSAFRGYFQGQQNMYPTAFSEVIESFGKLVFGIALAWLFIGESVEKAATGAVFGVTTSTFLSLVFIVLFFAITKRERSISIVGRLRSRREIAKELVVIAFPITIGVAVSSLTNVVDMMTITRRLQDITQVTPEFMEKYKSLINAESFSGAIDSDLANKLYGLYSGYALQMFNLPLTMIVALATSVLPAISGALAKHDMNMVDKTVKSVIKTTILFSLPASVGLAVLAEPVLLLILNSSLAANLLSVVCVAIVFVSLVQVTNAILQAYGKMTVPVVNMVIGGAVKVVCNYALIANPALNIDGAPIGTIACYFVITVLNFIHIKRVCGVKFGVLDLAVKPILASAGMGAVVYYAMVWFGNIGLGLKAGVLPAIVVGVAVYVVLAFALGAVREVDILMLPGGRAIAYKLKRMKLLRS
jgi:stage V sporulation protein B